MFKILRIAVLLIILMSVWTTFLLQKNVSRHWQDSIDIKIIPVVADTAPQTKKFVAQLKEKHFANIERYLSSQARRYQQDLESSIRISIGELIDDTPPSTPNSNQSTLDIIWWSLKLRWWAWRNQPDDYHDTQIRMYVLYQSPENDKPLPHSTGLQNGLIGLIQARADSKYRNLHATTITHELLHIFGATDKYNIASGQPIYPQGYANSKNGYRYPQNRAEIMARAIPLKNGQFEVATRLGQTVIGAITASEIGWISNATSNTSTTSE